MTFYLKGTNDSKKSIQEIKQEEIDRNSSKDKKVIFDEKEHSYKYEDKYLLSVTQFIKKFTSEFDTIFSSNSKAKKNLEEEKGLTNPAKLRWYWRLLADRSTSLGTATHLFSQLYMLDRSTLPKTGYDKSVIAAIEYLESEGYQIISQEKIVYSLEYMIAGSLDLKLKKDNNFYIGDWKITEDMNKSYKKLLFPFNELNDSSLNKYSIQTDIYSLLDEDYIPEQNRIIIQLKNDGTFNLYTGMDKTLPYTLPITKKALEYYKTLI